MLSRDIAFAGDRTVIEQGVLLSVGGTGLCVGNVYMASLREGCSFHPGDGKKK